MRLAIDWDGTQTTRDTLHIVAWIGYDHSDNRDLPSWDELVRAYISDYTNHEAHYVPVANDRKTVVEESEWLASLRTVELKSIERVKATGIFTGVTREEIISASKSAIHDKKIQLRHGWRELIAVTQKSNEHIPAKSPISIISVNWSRTFIRGCLETALEEGTTGENTIQTIPIFANEVYPVDKDAGHVYTSADKLAIFQNLRGSDNCPMIYIGDSPTDFECLVTADIGICVRDDPIGSGQEDLKSTLDRLGFEVFRLCPMAWHKQEENGLDKSDGRCQGTKKSLWWVADLMEVVRFIENC